MTIGNKKLLVEQLPVKKWITISIRGKITSKLFGMAIDCMNTLLESTYNIEELG